MTQRTHDDLTLADNIFETPFPNSEGAIMDFYLEKCTIDLREIHLMFDNKSRLQFSGGELEMRK